ncbi:hypothetical protein WA556_006680 [Blastocystis sp. ATCC 50177/Nand II]
MIGIRRMAESGVDSARDLYNNTFRESRIKHDIAQYDDDCGVELVIPDPTSFESFQLIVEPVEGIYRDQHFVFEVSVPEFFPNEPYKLRLLTPIFHPNIDQEGHVCLNILRRDWSPSIDLTQIACSLQFLLAEPNPDDPLNEEAARLYKMDIASFIDRAQKKQD